MNRNVEPHRFRVEIQDVECRQVMAEISYGDLSHADEICRPLCYSVVEIVCPYPAEKADCALWMECDHLCPDVDPKYDASANFTYKFNLDLPKGDPDRYVRVWDADATPQSIALALEYEVAMEEWEEFHHGSFEKVVPEQCWVQRYGDWGSIEEALGDGQAVDHEGWYEAYVDNGGSIDESELILYAVPA